MARDAPWVQFFAGVELNRALRDITNASARQGEENDEADEADDGNDKNAAFGAGGPAAEDWLACGVGGEKMVLRHSSAVGDAPEEGLRPVPCGVEADRPPQRAGAPETEAKHHADQAGREHADRRFAWILAVAEAEELLEQADQKEAEQPRGPVTKNIAAKEQATVDDEQTGLPEAQNEEGKTDH